MSFLEDYRSLQSWLRLTVRPGEKLGPSVEPGESFLMCFRVTNTAPSGPLCSVPPVNFRNPRLILAETERARPVGSGTLWLDLPEPYLRPGESTFLDVELIATRRLLGPIDFAGQLTNAVSAWITADLDLDALFKIWTTAQGPLVPTAPDPLGVAPSGLLPIEPA